MAKKKQKGGRAVQERLGVVLKAVLIFCCACGIGLGVYLGGRLLVGSVVRDPMFRVDPVCLSLKLPACVRKNIYDEIAIQLSYLREMSIFNPRLPLLVASALRNSPWVLRVSSVRRELPNHLSLRLEFRKPAGIVEVGRQRYLVDINGFWLPSRLFRWSYRQKPPVIVGKNIKDWPPRGRKWDNPAVRAGAIMTLFLIQNRRELPGIRFARIDVTWFGRRRQTGKSCIVLVTDGGVKINWGCSPLCSILPGLCRPAGELTDDEKLEGLKRVLRLKPGLAGCKLVDVRFKTPVIVASAKKQEKNKSGGN